MRMPSFPRISAGFRPHTIAFNSSPANDPRNGDCRQFRDTNIKGERKRLLPVVHWPKNSQDALRNRLMP